MSKVPLNNIGSAYGAIGALNDNFDTIEQGFDNTLSRDGTGPNQMEANFDMNSNDILNVRRIDASDIYLNGVPVIANGGLIPPAPGPASLAVDKVSDLRALTGTDAFVQTRGYWEAYDGGGSLYALRPSSSPSPGDNKGLTIERADGRWYSLIVDGDFVNAKALGVYTSANRLEAASGTPGYFNRWTGAKPSTHLAPAVLPTPYSTVDALNAAISQVRSIGKGLLIDGVVHCDKQIVISAPVNIKFAGRTGRAADNTDLNMPQSYFFQANTAMVGSVVVIVEHPGVHFIGGGILGTFYFDAAANFYFPEGPARDGIFVGCNGFRWDNGVVARMGRDGIRIGDYTGGAGTNANSVRLDGCVTAYNGNNGLTINDASGILDANVFEINSLFSHHNFNSGIELANTYLGGKFSAPVVENNGRGWFVNATAFDFIIDSGDTEANTGWRGDLPSPYTVATALNNFQVDPAVDGKFYYREHVEQGTCLTTLPTGSRIKNNQNAPTNLTLENTNTLSNASSGILLSSDAGLAAFRKFNTGVGGDLQLGNAGAFPLMLATNNINRVGIAGSGAVLLNNASDAGASGQVFTSQGAGSPPIWTTPSSGGGSVLTTKGDLYTFTTANARLAVGANGQVLTADSATPSGLKWSTITGTGTVTSVGMTVPLGLSVTGSPITAAGSLNLAWGAGYQGFLTADKVKLDSINTSNLALLGASNTFTGATQTVNTSANSPVGCNAINLNTGSGAVAQFAVESNAGQGGLAFLSVAAGGQMVVGHYNTAPLAIMHNGVFRIFIDGSGNIEFRGLPGSAGGNPERVWRDGAGFLRIG
jgi:hypothetical protein